MENVVKQDLEWAYRFLGYGPVVLVSTTDGFKGDVSTVAWCAPCAKSPPTVMIAIGKSHKTYENIARTGYFGINVPTADQLDLVMYCGTRSGHKEDKLSRFPIETGRGIEFDKLPMVSACAAWLECKLVPWLEAGDQSIVVARAVAAYCREGVLNEDKTWNAQDFPPVHHLGGRKFIVGSQTTVAP